MASTGRCQNEKDGKKNKTAAPPPKDTGGVVRRFPRAYQGRKKRFKQEGENRGGVRRKKEKRRQNTEQKGGVAKSKKTAGAPFLCRKSAEMPALRGADKGGGKSCGGKTGTGDDEGGKEPTALLQKNPRSLKNKEGEQKKPVLGGADRVSPWGGDWGRRMGGGRPGVRPEKLENIGRLLVVTTRKTRLRTNGVQRKGKKKGGGGGGETTG